MQHELKENTTDEGRNFRAKCNRMCQKVETYSEGGEINSMPIIPHPA